MKNIICDEELMDFLDGNLDTSATADLRRRLSENGEEDLLHHLRLAQKAMIESMDAMEAEYDSRTVAKEITIGVARQGKQGRAILVLDPLRLAAAKKEGYLCDIECEEFVLLSLGFETTKKTLLDEAFRNKWMKEKGMPIYHIGRLLEKNKLAVSRRYNASVDDLEHLLSGGNKLIAVVNANKLLEKSADEYQKSPNHAVVVIKVDIAHQTVELFDPQTGHDMDCYSLEQFLRAWTDSQRFLVVANRQDAFAYDPQPIDVDDVSLSSDLDELGEAIAENAHEIWAKKRTQEGWTWGERRNDERKETPDMVPYSLLPEQEKDYDRAMAMQTLKLIEKIGYSIVKK